MSSESDAPFSNSPDLNIVILLRFLPTKDKSRVISRAHRPVGGNPEHRLFSYEVCPPSGSVPDRGHLKGFYRIRL